jgi:arylsulfatase A-like enzyme
MLALLGLVLTGLAAYLCRDSLTRLDSGGPERPSYILMVLDDLDWDLVEDDFLGESKQLFGEIVGEPRFPVMHELASRGAVFSNFHATTPVCGPARASILSGQYAHRHQARVNRPNHPTAHGFAGGVSEYGRNRDFARYLQAGGYQTCFVGKYVHDGFEPDREQGVSWPDLMPHGWDRFHACLGARYQDFLAVDSASNRTQKVPEGFRTDYEADQVIAMLAEQERTKKSQLVCWFALAPHDAENSEKTYPDRLQNEFADELPPSLGRQTGAAGLRLPAPLQLLPDELSSAQRAMVIEKWRERLRSLKAFDENLGRIRDYLAQEDRLKNTVFVITSDHGYRLGDHGHVGKRLPYDRITRVPLLISGAGIPAGRSQRLLANIDLAPTLIDLALGPQAVLSSEFDGQSFVPLLLQPNIDPRQRQEILIECWEAENVWGQQIPGVWTILRGENYAYTEWGTGDREYYELDSDPDQLDNRYEALNSEQIGSLRNRMLGIRQSAERHPIATIQAESLGRLSKTPQNLTYVPLWLSGFADAESGIESVGLEVHDVLANQYWNGRHWQNDHAWIPAELRNPDGLVSQWNCRLQMQTPAEAASPSLVAPVDTLERKVNVSVRVVGKNGQAHMATLQQQLQMRPMDPETWVIVNAEPDAVSEVVELSGYAFGVSPIRNVRVAIQDKENKSYWDGKSWVEKYTHIEANIESLENGIVQWRYTFTGGLYHRLYFSARAMDAKNNFDKTPAFFERDLAGEVAGEFSNNAVRRENSILNLNLSH